MSTRDTRKGGGLGGLSWRTIAALLLALLVLLFVVLNRDETEISFVFFSARTALWVALLLAALGGFLAGFLMGRSRYRR